MTGTDARDERTRGAGVRGTAAAGGVLNVDAVLARGQVVVRVGAVALHDLVTLGVAERDHGATAIIGELATGSHRGADDLAVALAVLRGVRVDLQAFEVLLRDEVHHARDGVRAVHGRSTTRHHVHALDEGGRDEVDVDGTAGAERGQALAVHQDEGTVRAEATQVDGGGARVAVVDVFRGARQELRHLTQRAFQVDRVQLLEGLGSHRGDGAVGLEVRLGDTRTGDDDFHRVFVGGERGRRIKGRGGRAGHQRQAHGASELGVAEHESS